VFLAAYSSIMAAGQSKQEINGLSSKAGCCPVCQRRYDTLPTEQIRNEPGREGGGFGRMARRRYQKPAPKRRGDQWTILVREDQIQNEQRTRKVKRIPLGPATLTRADAERLRDEYLAAVNHPNIGIGGACQFRDFVQTYEVDVLPTLASTSQERSRSVLKNYLKPELGELMLREITLERLQGYFMRLHSSKLSFESIDKIRDVLSAVLRTAVDYGRLLNNPVEKVRLKRRKQRGPKPFLRIEQFYNLLDSIAEPYGTMIYVAVFTALRVSELAGLRWRNVHAQAITVDERYSRGDFDAPKSDASRATISVDAHVIERIQQLKTKEVLIRAGRATRKYKAVKSDDPDDLVFQSVVKGAPMRDNNILVRHIKPVAKHLKIGWVNWQVLRRSCATWLQQAGVDVKDAQGILRHSRASTTQDIYQQLVPESQITAVRKLTAYAAAGRVVQ
jgi:integrase